MPMRTPSVPRIPLIYGNGALMFTTHYDEHTGSWRAYWNGTLYAVSGTEEHLRYILSHWKQH